MERVILKTQGRLYRIPKAPFEPASQTCERGWTIAELSKGAEEGDARDAQKQKKWVRQSFETCYVKQGMQYD